MPAAVGLTIATIGMKILTSVIVSVVASFVMSAIMPKPKSPSSRPFDGGRQEMVRQLVTARRVIYGTAKVSGPIIYAESYDKEGSRRNKYFSDIVIMAAHEVESFDSIWFDDTELTLSGNDVTNEKYKNPNNGNTLAFIYTHAGTAGQAADAELVASSDGIWTSAHRLRGVAYIHKQLKYRAENWPAAPKLRAVIKGKKCFDPRTSTTIWTQNPAICLRDYMTSYLGIPSSEINDTTVNAAANVCDENVSLAAGGTQTRYTLNGIVNLDTPPVDVIRDMLSAMAGTITYVGGNWAIYAGASTAANAEELDEDDLSGAIKVMPRLSRREIFNAVKAVYIDAAKDYQPTTAALVSNSQYEADDGGDQIVTNLELVFTDDPVRAQRLAKIELERIRQQITVSMRLKPGSGMKLTAWDVVNLSNSHFGWSSKAFRVVEWKMLPQGDVAVTLREESAAMWSWSAEETTVDPAPDTNLPSPFEVAAPGGITITEELAATATGTVQTILTIVVTEVEDEFVERYELQYKRNSDSDYISLGTQTGTLFTITGVEDGTLYDFQAKAINGIGIGSAWKAATFTPIGQTSPPADVANFNVNIVDGTARLTWDAVADVDLSHYRIRWSKETTGVTWASAIDLVPRVARPATSVEVPSMVGTYLIKAVDFKGNESTNVTAIISTIAAVAGLNLVLTETEDPTFAGAKSNVIFDSILGGIKLDGTEPISAWTQLADVDILATGIAGSIQSSGTYTFVNTVDVGAVYTSRVTALLRVTATNYTNLIKNWPALKDIEQLGQTDASTHNVKVEIRTTDDDPAGAPTWSAWQQFAVGDYTCRGMQFRATLESFNQDVSPIVHELAVTVDMPDRTIGASDIAANAAGETIIFSPAFKALHSVGVAGQDLATGDYWAITSKTANGFTIRFFNSSDVGISRTFDWSALGYGEISA